MKRSFLSLVIKIGVYAVAALILVYGISRYALPSITVVNHSGQQLTSVIIQLPSNRLDFGSISHEQQNTLHYTLKQKLGAYHYQVTLADLTKLTGQCGQVIENEVHKRVTITVNEHYQIHCKQT